MFAATAAQVGELGLQFLLTGLVKKVILGDDISRPMTDGETMGAALLGGLYLMIVKCFVIKSTFGIVVFAFVFDLHCIG